MTTITIGTYNVANNVFDEKTELRFIKRREKVADQIASSKCDVLFLQEIRKHSNEDKHYQVSPVETLFELKGEYSVGEFRPRNLGEMAFWTACLYNPKTVKYVESYAKWLVEPHADTSKESGRGIMAIFMHFETLEGTSFWAINGYLPTQNAPEMLPQKLKAIEKLGEFADEIATYEPKAPIFYCGDQNTYFHGHGNVELGNSKGAYDIVGKFTSGFWHHLSGIKIKTFRSFPHDTVQCEDTLDHFFMMDTVNRDILQSVEAMKDEKYASDHLLLKISVKI